MDTPKLTDAANALLAVLEKYADDTTLSGSEKRMNQNDRNALKRDTKAALVTLARVICAGSETVDVFENEKGIAFRLDNESVGFITLTVDPMIKDLDYDPEFEAEEFVRKQAESARKAAEREAIKAQKIAEDEAVRAKKEELKRLKAERKASGEVAD